MVEVVALDLDVFVLCRRDQEIVEAFLGFYANPDELKRDGSAGRG